MSLISVIIPSYNRANLLPRAIQSVLDQRYDLLQLIVVDDGSTDNTFDVVSKIHEAPIEYIRFEHNQGIGAARHEGIRRAQGKYIAFIDSDDLWLPGKLELQLRLFHEYPQLEMIFGNFFNINHVVSSKELGFHQTKKGLAYLKVRQLELGVKEIISGFPRALLESNFISPPTVLIQADLVHRVGNFDSSLSGPEDFEFWWRLAAHGAQIAFTEEPLIERHKDAKSITSQVIHFSSQKLRALELCEQTSRRHGQPELLPALRRAKHCTWCGLIRAHALQGERQEALRCFAQSLRYGLSREVFMYTAAALAGPAAINRAKRMRRALTKGNQLP